MTTTKAKMFTETAGTFADDGFDARVARTEYVLDTDGVAGDTYIYRRPINADGELVESKYGRCYLGLLSDRRLACMIPDEVPAGHEVRDELDALIQEWEAY